MMDLTLTPDAVKMVRGFLNDHGDTPDAGLRVAVMPGGCSGFQYGFSFDARHGEDDAVVEQDGIRVVVDNMSLVYVAGSEIDFVEDLIGSSFSLRNPNATASCSCGSSFAV